MASYNEELDPTGICFEEDLRPMSYDIPTMYYKNLK